MNKKSIDDECQVPSKRVEPRGDSGNSSAKRKLDVDVASDKAATRETNQPNKKPAVKIVAPLKVDSTKLQGFNFANPNSDSAAAGAAPSSGNAAPAAKLKQKIRETIIIDLDEEPDASEQSSSQPSQGMTTRHVHRSGEGTKPFKEAKAATSGPKHEVTVDMQILMTEETKQLYEKTAIFEIQQAVMISIKHLVNSKKKNNIFYK